MLSSGWDTENERKREGGEKGRGREGGSEGERTQLLSFFYVKKLDLSFVHGTIVSENPHLSPLTIDIILP